MSPIKKTIKKTLLRSIRPICWRACEHMTFVPPGHYYSPYPSDEDNETARSRMGTGHAHIDLREQAQIELLYQLRAYYPRIPNFPYEGGTEYRFSYNNHYFSYSDTTMLACLLQHLRPRRIIDVGGGMSTLLMMDLSEALFSDVPISIDVIQPDSEGLRSKLRPDDTIQILTQKVQDVDVAFFERLERNDVLFLDSTHVSKLGSDINHMAFEVLPKRVLAAALRDFACGDLIAWPLGAGV